MNSKSEYSIFKTIMAAFLILVVHLVLVGGIGVLVLFFYGIFNHTVWMVLGIAGILTGGGYWVLRRLKTDGKELTNVVNSSLMQGKSVEVSFLGGIANFKINNPETNKSIQYKSSDRPKQIEDPGSNNVQTLADLAHLYEKKLITKEEYERAKKKLFK